MYITRIDIDKNDIGRFGVLALLMHAENCKKKENKDPDESRALTKSPWLVIDHEDRAQSPVKFFYFLNPFFDG